MFLPPGAVAKWLWQASGATAACGESQRNWRMFTLIEVWIFTRGVLCEVSVGGGCFVYFYVLTEACADCVKVSFFKLGFESATVYFGSLDPNHSKPGPVHGLTVGLFLLWVCVGVKVSSCMKDEAGWTIIFLFCLFNLFLPQNGWEWKTTTCIHIPLLLPSSSVNQQAEWIQMEPT